MCEICDPCVEPYSDGLCLNCIEFIRYVNCFVGKANLIPYFNRMNNYIEQHEFVIPTQDFSNYRVFDVFITAVDGKKKCHVCRRVLDATRKNFHYHSGHKDGFNDKCIPCKKDYDKWRHLYKNYGMPKNEWLWKLKSQEYRCAICRRVFTAKLVPHNDHSHKTGKNRGLLCLPCNSVLGFGYENPEIYKSVIAYIERYSD